MLLIIGPKNKGVNVKLVHIQGFFYKKDFYKKMSLKTPKTLRKCLENL